ncbi:MAG TPA: HepT-like ribonuclease domain-containing protein [Xanthobacteraceae bacterium]|nr:HepT-like ribonuclease domain-containing protein [Xanthobacteraceae bacterium]
MRSIPDLLADARDYARRAASYVDRMDFPAFAADTMRRQAVYFCLMVVGEACDQILLHKQPVSPEIPWREIKAMRNFIVHMYWDIDDEIVYSVARHDAIVLADQLDEVLRQLAPR